MINKLLNVGFFTAAVALVGCAGGIHKAPPEAPMLPKTTVVAPKGAIEVTVRKDGDGFVLLREGKPYYINGVGFGKKAHDDYYHMKVLADMGGNSVRTWGVGDPVTDFKEMQVFMDKAYEFGLTVDLGLWVNHQRHGFDYDDEVRVEKRFQEFKKAVEIFKGHPALLMWNLGNEVTMSLEHKDYNKKVWDFVGRLDRMIKEIDGKHPTLTTVHQVEKGLIDDIKKGAPGLDILGINKYGGIGGAIRAAPDEGWDKAIVVTEFGTRGGWEVPKTSWGAPLEPYGIKKAMYFKQGIRAIKGFDKCIGSYAFVWGEHQEITKSWFTLVMDRGRTIPATDELVRVWNGKYPDNRAPFIQSFTINGQTHDRSLMVDMGQRVTVKVVGKDKEDKDNLKFVYTLREENQVRTSGGDHQADPLVFEMDNPTQDNGDLEFDAPVIPGQYRLYIKLYDAQGKICNGTFPFMVN